jgi:hypothetical protein
LERDAEGGGRIDVRICAAPDAHTVGSGNAGAGRIVAQITNLDPIRKEARWELEPMQTYLVIVTRGNQFQIVGPGNADNPHRSGEYYRCQPPHPQPTSSAAKWGNCEEAGHMVGTSAGGAGANKGGPSDQSDGSGRANLSIYNGPAWITCPTGCCTTERQ